MRDEYDLKNLKPRRNPYVKKLKKQVTINLNIETIEYFKDLSGELGIPYQTLINMYLNDCVKQKKRLKFD
ncbi:MAG TPA: antitoxin [Eubacterium sp.]|nr:antitoxin [Eubacterium sp.]